MYIDATEGWMVYIRNVTLTAKLSFDVTNEFSVNTSRFTVVTLSEDSPLVLLYLKGVGFCLSY